MILQSLCHKREPILANKDEHAHPAPLRQEMARYRGSVRAKKSRESGKLASLIFATADRSGCICLI